jgi:flagellin-like hook-associated protein FlgL
MRVSSAQFFAASSASMQNTQSNLLTLQQQIASGIALTSAGDNPSAFGQMAQLQQTQDTNDQYQSNRFGSTGLAALADRLAGIHALRRKHALNRVPEQRD